jgi:colanic acid/amylovoran biosynthesis glycosyltransferase
MNVLYCTHTSISVSETFLKKTLHFLANEFQVTIISTSAKGDTTYPCDGYFLNIHPNRFYKLVLEIVNRLLYRKSSEQTIMDFERRSLMQFFKKTQIKADFAVIEYGTSAYKFVSALSSLNIPYVICFHGYDATAYLGFNWYTRKITEICNSSCMNVVPSNHLRRRLELIGVKNELITVAPCSPNYDELPKRQPKNPITITALGRMTEKKCPEALIYAAKLVVNQSPKVKFDIIGGGPLLKECERLVTELGLSENVNLLGVLEHQQALNVLAEASVFVQHSVTSAHGDQEGFPVAIAEASAMGIPIVSTCHSGIPEGIIDGVTGFLVQEHDFEAMAERILTLIGSDALRTQMGNEGSIHIRKVAPPFERERLISDIIKS